MAFLVRLCEALLSLPLWLSKALRQQGLGRLGGISLACRRARGKAAIGRTSATSVDVDRRAAAAAATACLARMSEALRALLDEHAGNRQVFRHLAAFERVFARKGLGAIERLSATDLRNALDEFESMVRNWSSAGLADLRSRIAVALIERNSAASVWIDANSVQPDARPARSSFKWNREVAQEIEREMGGHGSVDVDDVSVSRFEAAGGEWKHDSRPVAFDA